LFDEVAASYDRLNDLLSLGLHRVWKSKLIDLVRPVSGEKWIDLCCGTGDLSLAIARIVTPGGNVLGIDSALEPLEIAKKRGALDSSLPLSWLQADALSTGLPSREFDGVVMAYGLRNLADPIAGLREVRRLLRPGGRAGILDFNRTIEGSLAAGFQDFYLSKLVVPVAAKFGLREHYAYIQESLKSFPDGALQERMAFEVGFIEARHRSLATGQMGVLILRA